MMIKGNRLRLEKKGMVFTKANPYRFKKTLSNSIACYRMEEGISIQTLSRILGISCLSAKELCESTHPSAKYIHTLALREGLSVTEFQLRYVPIGEDAA